LAGVHDDVLISTIRKRLSYWGKLHKLGPRTHYRQDSHSDV